MVYTTARGSEAESSVLPPSDLFDMIAAAVDDNQQIELAVGNPVTFQVDAGSNWNVLAEPGMEGIRVRAERPMPAASSLELVPDDNPYDETSEAEFEDPGVAPGAFADVDFPSEQSISEATDSPYESGTWELGEDSEGSEASEASEVAVDSRPVPGSLGTIDGPALDSEEYIGVPADDEDDDGFDPFEATVHQARRITGANSVPDPIADPLVEAGFEFDREPDPEPEAAYAMPDADPRGPDSPTIRTVASGRGGTRTTRREIPVMSATARTRRELGAVANPDGDTQRELASVGPGAELSELAAMIGEGSLVYVGEPGFAETLAEGFQAPTVLLDDRVDPYDAWSQLRSLPVGAIVIVAREDPSGLLGWILRRLEEGNRVFLETRARNPAGARRILLGLDASDRAEKWLRAQTELVIEPSREGPRVRVA